MKLVFQVVLLVFSLTSHFFGFGQCNPDNVMHYNTENLPATMVSGVGVSYAATIHPPDGPFTASCGTVDYGTIIVAPLDSVVFTFTQAVDTLSFIIGGINVNESGYVLSNGATAILSSTCPDLSFTADTFVRTSGAELFNNTPIQVIIPGGATEITFYNSAGGSGYNTWSLDLLDCLDNINCVPNSSTQTVTACNSFTWVNGETYTSSNNTAVDTLINSDGCDSIVSLDLTIYPVNTSITLTNATFLVGEVGANYQWLHCPSMTPIAGATNISYVANQNGDYAVIVTTDECTDTSACATLVGLGFGEIETLNSVAVYPNPTHDKITIDLGESQAFVQLTLTDLQGKQLLTKRYSNCHKIDLNVNERAGVYILLLETNEHISTTRVIVAAD